MQKITAVQPLSDPKRSEKNTVLYDPLQGFVASITPFNFTAIGGHLALAPLLTGNNVIWKPSENAVLSNYLIAEAFYEAGIPHSALQFITCDPCVFASRVLSHSDLGAVAFTGSSQVLDKIFSSVYSDGNIGGRSYYPRIIGESGGKNFHLVLPDANPEYVAEQTILSAFEYSGQKCSACSRLYLPESRADEFLSVLKEKTHRMVRLGPADQGGVFTSALINEASAMRINDFLSLQDDYTTVYEHHMRFPFQGPVILKTDHHRSELMTKEFFAPILGVYVYPDFLVHGDKLPGFVDEIGKVTPYGLTGSIFSNDIEKITALVRHLRPYAGNLYINCKSTGSIVGYQPFGGGRKSGTNDKAGFGSFLTRFTNQRTIRTIVDPGVYNPILNKFL